MNATTATSIRWRNTNSDNSFWLGSVAVFQFSSRILILIMLVGWSIPKQEIVAQVSHDELGKYVSELLYAGRNQLRQGVLTVNGKCRQGGEESEFKVYIAFDYDLLQSRIDRERTVFDFATKEALTEKGHFVRTPDKVISYREGDNIFILPVHSADPDFARPFDVRVLGLAYFGDVLFGKTFDFVWDSYKKNKVTAREGEQSGTFFVTWIGERANADSADASRREMIIDESRGSWPTELKVYLGKNPAPIIESSLSLIQVNGFWVPSIYGVRDGENSIEMELTWESVNAEISGNVFDYRAFGAPPGTMIVDTRTTPHPRVVETIADHYWAVQLLKNWWWRIAILVLGFGALFAFLLRRRNSSAIH